MGLSRSCFIVTGASVNTQAFKVEEDTLGVRKIPIDVLYGSQTDRAIENFRISGRTLAEWPFFISAFAFVKEVCAFANLSVGKLPERKFRAIVLACEEIRIGIHDGAFAVDIFDVALARVQLAAGDSSSRLRDETNIK
jgi:aspartate ammonia-lyase